MRETMVTVSGNVITDPILRVLESGSYLLSFRIASNSRKFDQNNQEWVDGTTLYLSVTCWGKLAINAQEVLHKGKAILVTGYIRTNEFVGSDGIKRSSVELKAIDLGLSLTRPQVHRRDREDELGNNNSDRDSSSVERKKDSELVDAL